MKRIAIATALALVSSVALAQTTTGTGQGTTTSQQRQATPSVANSQLSKNAQDYWKQNSRDGYMSREMTMGYRGADGQPYTGPDGKGMDFADIDTDGDGRCSAQEWTAYHSQSSGAGATGASGATNAPGTGTSR